MKRFITKDPNIQWEDTGRVVVYNYPAERGTFSYLARIYREYRRGEFGSKEVEGEPIYFHQLSGEQLALATIIGEAQKVLAKTLPREDFILDEAPF